MRILLPLCAALAISACAPDVPDSAQGVGFQNYDTYLAQQRLRDAQLAGQAVPNTARPPVSGDPVITVRTTQPQTSAEQTASAAVAAVRGTGTQTTVADSAAVRGAQTQGQATVASSAAVRNPNNPGISDEQDFDAVSSRQSIQSDAERLRNQSAQYVVIQPTALPKRPKGTSPTPIEFALETRHPVGQKVYRRGPFASSKTERACAGYTSGEAAQDAFLKAGGPDRDKLGLDPDGDGYACRWNPGVYRGVARN